MFLRLESMSFRLEIPESPILKLISKASACTHWLKKRSFCLDFLLEKLARLHAIDIAYNSLIFFKILELNFYLRCFRWRYGIYQWYVGLLIYQANPDRHTCMWFRFRRLCNIMRDGGVTYICSQSVWSLHIPIPLPVHHKMHVRCCIAYCIDLCL